jgi:hypothetical protein
MAAAKKSSSKPVTKTFGPEEWDFETVPDEELVACCYWEYARESAFIRGLRQRCWDHWRPLYLMERWWDEPQTDELNHDLRTVQGIGYPSEVILRGICCPPDGVLPDAPPLKPGQVHPVTGSFPRPWRTLTPQERTYRSHIGSDATRIPLTPFERGLSFEAREIAEWVGSRQRAAEVGRQRVCAENPGRSLEQLCEKGLLRFPAIDPSLKHEHGPEVTVVRIHWGRFTNEEIVESFRKWVRQNRPHGVQAPDQRGRKARDWRVALERLAMLRLLHRFTVRELRTMVPAAWKLYARREWYKERKRAGAKFHALFPFLPKTDRPLAWQTKGGRGR